MEMNWAGESKDAVESHGKYISAINRHMQILIAAELAEFRIGSGQYIFLMAIAGQEPITQKRLSESLLIDKTTTAKAIAKLETDGYMRREPAPADNRYHLLPHKVLKLPYYRFTIPISGSRFGAPAK
ncbi:MarR family winged helix-turn-helix transcriptional regulator [Paenibacillaceae bacterium WGS1546]|uniref:MarR family winged helix-turn-helix transcriptional regulator n=1 Tax=Cohnella sp. WGS1546 TaxID=3366810 RepID=UPI00372CFC37